MAVLKLQLLGGFKALTESGQEIVIHAKKGRALLAILALSPPGGMSRERLAALLWSDRGEDQARSSLRQTLTTLRKELGAVGENIIMADDQRVEINRDAMQTDVASIVDLSPAANGPSLRNAAKLYQGEFLADLAIDDKAFEDWLAIERSRIRNMMTSLFDRLLPFEPPVERIAIAKRLLALDPLREASNIALMTALADTGERAMALQHYSTFRDMLKSELNVQPGQEVEELKVRLAKSAPPKPAAESTEAKPHERPSIAVLTFANLSADPAQRYFSDGITADIVTELSRFHQLQVHGHRQVAGRERPAVDAAETGRELGVQYVVEGSVRRMGQRVRITAQLIDSGTAENVWAERFDANEDDIFAMQDQIVRSIAAQLFGKLRMAKLEKLARKPPSSMAAYDYVLRGDALPIGVREAETEARRLFQKAIDLDPGFGRAHAHLATHITLQWVRDYEASASLLDQALELAKKAVALDAREEFCHSALGYVYLQRNAHELAEYHYHQALALNPNHPSLLASLGILYGFRGELDRSLAYFREAITINPHFIPTWYWRNRAVVHFSAHEYEEAIIAFYRSPIMPDWVEAYLAAAHAQLGRMDEARQHVAAALRLMPNLGIGAIMSREPYLHRKDATHLADALRKAGFGE